MKGIPEDIGTHSRVAAALFVVVTPLVYAAYVRRIYEFRELQFDLGLPPAPGEFVPPAIGNLAISWAAIALVCTVLLLAWRRQYRLGPVLACGLLLSYPWWTDSPYPLSPTIAVPVTFATALVATEFLWRRATAAGTETAMLATAAGIAHLALGVVIQFLSRPQGVQNVLQTPAELLFLVGLGVVLTVLGAAPVVLRKRSGFVVPGMVLVGWALLGVLRMALMAPRLPLSAFTAPNPYLPAPDYLFSWPVLALIMLAGLAVEYLGRSHRLFSSETSQPVE